MFLEPGETGHRLRLKTTKGTAVAAMRGGIAAVVGGSALAAVLAATGQIGQTLTGPVIIVLAGLGVLGFTAVQLPGWARERARQMEAIVARLVRP